MRFFIVTLITFYQRFISPIKGFKCAHHVLHKQGSCSHSVKQLIMQHGVIAALPMVKARFNECRHAYLYLKMNPIPVNADLPCDFGVGECVPDISGDSSSCDCFSACDDFLPDWRSLSKRARRIIIITTVLVLLGLSYVFYGRGIGSVYLIDKGEQDQSLLTRLVQRDEPEIRVLLIVDGEKYYTNILKLDKDNVEYKFTLEKSLFNTSFERLEVLDARVNVANKLLVIGQVLEGFDDPSMSAQGQRFDYRIKRRWHLF